MSTRLRKVWEWAVEGTKHDIPWCCGIRFGIDCERPKPLRRLFPQSEARRRVVTPRWAFGAWFGDGYIPCEYHLIRWVLTGKRPYIKQDPT